MVQQKETKTKTRAKKNGCCPTESPRALQTLLQAPAHHNRGVPELGGGPHRADQRPGAEATDWNGAPRRYPNQGHLAQDRLVQAADRGAAGAVPRLLRLRLVQAHPVPGRARRRHPLPEAGRGHAGARAAQGREQGHAGANDQVEESARG